MAELPIAIDISAKDNASGAIGNAISKIAGLKEAVDHPIIAFKELASEAVHSFTEISSNASNPIKAFSSIADATSRAYSAISSGASGAVHALGSIASAAHSVIGFLSQIPNAITGATQVIKGVGDLLGFNINKDLQNVRAQFNALTKDAGATEAIISDLRAEATKTPFTLQELAKATAGLLPAAKQSGTAYKDLIQQAEILAASNPAQGLEGAAFALREAVSGDFTSVIERFNLPRTMINDLKKEGVPALEIVKQSMAAMGYDMSLVANMATTVDGRMSTFWDTIDGIRLSIGEGIFNVFNDSLIEVQKFLDDNIVSLQAFGKALGSTLGTGLTSAIRAVGKLVNALAPAGKLIGQFVKYLSPDNDYDLMRALFGPNIGPRIDEVVRSLGSIVTAVTGIVNQVVKLVSGQVSFGRFFDNIRGLLEIGFKSLGKIDINLLGILGELIGSALNGIAGLVEHTNFSDVGKAILSGIGGALSFLGGIELEHLAGLADIGKNILDFILEKIGGISIDLSGLGLTITSVWEWIKSGFAKAVDFSGDAIEWVKDKLGDITIDLSGVKATLTGASDWITKNIGPIKDDVVKWIGEQWGNITSTDWKGIWVKTIGIGKGLYDSGITIVKSITAWLGDNVSKIPWTEVWNKAVGVADGLKTAMKDMGVNDAIKAVIIEAFDATAWKKDIQEKVNHWIDGINFNQAGHDIGYGLVSATASALAGDGGTGGTSKTLGEALFGNWTYDPSKSISIVAQKAAYTFVSGLITGIAQFMSEHATDIDLQPLADGLKSSIDNAVKSINWGAIGANIVADLRNGFLGPAPQFIIAIADWIGQAISTAKDLLGIKSPSTVFFNIGADLMQGAIDGVASLVSTFITNTGDAVSDAISAAVYALVDTINTPYAIGKSIIDGLINGVNSRVDEFKTLVSGLGSSALSLLGKIIGFGSPAKKFVPLGASMISGLLLGVDQANFNKQFTNRFSKYGLNSVSGNTLSAAPSGGSAAILQSRSMPNVTIQISQGAIVVNDASMAPEKLMELLTSALSSIVNGQGWAPGAAITTLPGAA